MVDVVGFVAFVVIPTWGLVAAIGLSGYEIYRIGDYRLVFVIVLLGLMLQHQVLEWNAFWSTGRVTEAALGEVFETTANLTAAGGVYYLLALLRRERSLTETLDRREREFQSMVESSPTPMLYHCSDRIRLANDAATEMLEADDSEELLDRSLTEFVVGEDRETVEAAIGRSGDEDTPQGEQITLETVDGDQRYVVFSAEPLHFGGRDGVQITLNDITERERSRAELERTKDRLQTLFHNIQDGVVVIDLEADRILDANERACEMFGYTESELIGLSPADIHPHELERFESFLDSVERERTLVTDELSCRRKDGGRFAAEVSAGLMEVEGSPWLLVSIRDITERNRRKQQIDFLYRLFRHNVRNRMNVVVGHAQRIGERTSDDIARMAEMIESVGDRFIETSEKVRHTTAVLRDGVEPETGRTDVSDLVGTVVENFRERAPAATFETAIEDGVTIRGNDSVQMAVENLVENAVEHAGEEPTVRVAVRRDAAGPGTAVVVVEDDGPGIPDNERVVAADTDDRSQLNHGSGIGLHLVTQTVALYGGDVDIESPSEEGVGTRATITLPLASTTTASRTKGSTRV